MASPDLSGLPAVMAMLSGTASKSPPRTPPPLRPPFAVMDSTTRTTPASTSASPPTRPASASSTLSPIRKALVDRFREQPHKAAAAFFRNLDLGREGRVTAGEFERGCSQMASRLSPEEVHTLTERWTTDDGLVPYSSFVDEVEGWVEPERPSVRPSVSHITANPLGCTSSW
jgi:hypothetical protein